MSKRTTGYYLDESNIKWLEEQGAKQGRSASNYLDRLISTLKKTANDQD
jgi:hypothetical protein